MENNFDWIKVGAKCNWQDPALNEFTLEEQTTQLKREYEIIGIEFEDDTNTIFDDTIILIADDCGDVEVYPREIKPIF